MADKQDSFTLIASDNQADTCTDCGEPLLMMGEWQLVRGICPNWNKHTLVSDLVSNNPEVTTTATNTSPKPHHHKEG